MSSNVRRADVRRELSRAGIRGVRSSSFLPYRSSSSPVFLPPITPTPSSIGPNTPGYCYLTWFSGFSLELKNHLTTLLGPFPLLRTVLICLLGVYPGDVLLPGLVFVADGMVHVDGASAVWLSQLCSSYLFSPHIRVGVSQHFLVFLSGALTTAAAFAGYAGFTALFPGEREIAEAAVVVVGESTTSVANCLTRFSTFVSSSAAPLREYVCEVTRPLFSLTLSDFLSSLFRGCFIYPVAFYFRVTMSWPLVSSLLLSYFALPYLSRRFPRRGVAIYYCLMVPPAIGFIPAWILPMCRGVLHYFDTLLPARTPVVPEIEVPSLPQPDLYSFTRDDLVRLFTHGRSLPDPTSFDAVYDFHTIRVGGYSAFNSDDVCYPDPDRVYFPDCLPPSIRAGGPPVDDVDALARLAGVDTQAVVSELACSVSIFI